MVKNFLPAFHYENPEKKLKPEWCSKAANYCYYTLQAKNLLHGKKVKQIHSYATGEYDMSPYKRMFTSIRKAMDLSLNLPNQEAIINDADKTGLEWTPLPLIPPKLNSAIATITKIPVEVTCTASDELAAKKKKEDIRFLQNKTKVEEQLKGVAEQLGLGSDVDLGTTKYSAVPLGSSPYGLDLSQPDQLYIFENILYSLAVEAGFETMLQAWWNVKNAQLVSNLEVKDQFYYGVSCHRTHRNSTTGLPDLEYISPDSLFVPDSKLPDFSDNTHRWREEMVSAMDVYNQFSHQIGKGEKLSDADRRRHFDSMLNEKQTGYFPRNKQSTISPENWDNHKVALVYFEIKSVDWIGVKKVNKKSRFKTFTSDETEAEYKIWAQNTYTFVWLKNTDYFFDIEILDASYRTMGIESYQNFSTNIYKSQEKSCVEMAIAENKKAQIADIKLQYAIITSMPAGKYIDLRFLRNALDGLNAGEKDAKYTLDTLITAAFERNLVIGDTHGFDKPADGQMKPVVELQGGLKTEVDGYIKVIAEANRNISIFTGINEQLTGTGVNPEGLVGLQKLLINSSINSLYYCNQAISYQLKKLFSSWAYLFKQAIEQGGDTRKAIVSLIGSQKTQILDELDDMPLHNMGIFVDIGQREVERQRFEQNLALAKEKGIISIADEYMISYVSNPKDKMALLAVREKQIMERKAKEAEQQFQRQQALLQQQGQNQVQAIQTESEMKQQEIAAKAQAQAQLESLLAQLGFAETQMTWQAKERLQDKRMAGQKDKSISTIREKTNADAQSSLI